MLFVVASSVSTKEAQAQLVRELDGPTVESLALSPDGSRLAIAGRTDLDGHVQVVDAGTGELLFETRSGRLATSAAWSPDGRTLAIGSSPGRVELWQVASKERVRTIQQESEIRKMVFSPDGRLATAEGGGDLSLWNPADGRLIRSVRIDQNKVFDFTLLADGTIVALVGDWLRLNGGSVWHWNKEWRSPTTLVMGISASEFAISGNREWIAFGGANHVTLGSFGDRSDIALRELQPIRHFAFVTFSPDSKILAIASETRIALWDVANRERLADFEGHANLIKSLVFARDGKTIISGGWDAKVKWWKVPSDLD